MFRLFLILLVGLVLSSAAIAVDEVHEGEVQLAKDGKITLLDKDGNSEVFAVAADAKITLDGQPVKLDDIPNGSIAKVTVKTAGDKKVASVIDAKSKV